MIQLPLEAIAENYNIDKLLRDLEVDYTELRKKEYKRQLELLPKYTGKYVVDFNTASSQHRFNAELKKLNPAKIDDTNAEGIMKTLMQTLNKIGDVTIRTKEIPNTFTIY
jgi:hypothetical protein